MEGEGSVGTPLLGRTARFSLQWRAIYEGKLDGDDAGATDVRVDVSDRRSRQTVTGTEVRVCFPEGTAKAEPSAPQPQSGMIAGQAGNPTMEYATSIQVLL